MMTIKYSFSPKSLSAQKSPYLYIYMQFKNLPLSLLSKVIIDSGKNHQSGTVGWWYYVFKHTTTNDSKNNNNITLLTTINLKQPWSWFLKQSWMFLSLSLYFKIKIEVEKYKTKSDNHWLSMSDCRFHQNEKVKKSYYWKTQYNIKMYIKHQNSNQPNRYINGFTNFSVVISKIQMVTKYTIFSKLLLLQQQRRQRRKQRKSKRNFFFFFLSFFWLFFLSFIPKCNNNNINSPP